MGNDEGNRTIFFSDLFAAVGNELGNSHGAGTCKQLWNGNSGVYLMAAKIDSFVYACRTLKNAFPLFKVQNYGAGRIDRIKKGIKKAVSLLWVFSLCISAVVFFFARPLMTIFINAEETAISGAGVEYSANRRALYCGIGCLFCFTILSCSEKAGMSLILTGFSVQEWFWLIDWSAPQIE